MKLTEGNYYSNEAGRTWWSVSQYKDFMRCESAAMAKLRGDYEEPMTTAMLVGSYIDRFIEGTLDSFKEEHPEVFTKAGTLRAEFKKAEEIIKIITADEIFMMFLSGEKQKIITFEMFGVHWKMKMDSYSPGICITDLKVMKDFKSIPFWRYDIQGAIYQRGVEMETGEKLPFYIAAVTKEEVPDHDIFWIPQENLDIALRDVEVRIGRFSDIKAGLKQPDRCGKCNYCKGVKRARLRDYNELLEEQRWF